MIKKRFEIIDSAFIDGAKVIKDNEKKYAFPSTFETLFNYRKALNELDERYIAEFSLRETLQQELQRVEYENEQLKKDVEYWKQVASQYSNELNVFEHCKKYKTECKDIYWSSD